MQQVATCPECQAHLALPSASVDVSGTMLSHCAVCGHDFPLTVDRLTMLPMLRLTPKATPMSEVSEGFGAGIPPLAESVGAEAPTIDEVEPAGGAVVDEAPTTVDSPNELAEAEPTPTSLAALLRKQPDNTDLGQESPTPVVEEADSEPPAAPTLAELLNRREAPTAEAEESVAESANDAATLPPIDESPAVRVRGQKADAEEGALTEAAEEHEETPAAPAGVGVLPTEPLSRDFRFDLNPATTSRVPKTASTSATPLVVDAEQASSGSGVWTQFSLVTAGCLGGLVVGYYLLLLLGGPSRDALSVASVFPDVLLPTAFAQESAVCEDMVEKPAMEPKPVPQEEALLLAAESTTDKYDPETKPASFTEAIQGGVVGTPPKSAPETLWERLADGPRFGVDQLTESLSGSADAAQVLIEYSLAEPDGLQQIGLAYAKLCEVAQVITLLDTDASHPDMMLQRLDAEDLYRRLFRSAHVRSNSRQIASRWIAWPGRPHGGVFFSGLPLGPPRSAGDGLFRYDFDLGDGLTTTVVSPEMIRLRRFRGAEEMMIIGCVVDSPHEKIRGYEGDAKRVVWRATSIKLKQPDLP